MLNFYDGSRLIRDTTDPICYSLDRIKWRLFVTLTFNQNALKDPFRPKKAIILQKTKIFLNSLRGFFRISKRTYIFFCLYEKNEAQDIHIHLLLSEKAFKDINYFDIIEFITRKWDNLNQDECVQKDIQLINQDRVKQLTRYVSKRSASIKSGIRDLDYFIPNSFVKEIRGLSIY